MLVCSAVHVDKPLQKQTRASTGAIYSLHGAQSKWTQIGCKPARLQGANCLFLYLIV